MQTGRVGIATGPGIGYSTEAPAGAFRPLRPEIELTVVSEITPFMK